MKIAEAEKIYGFIERKIADIKLSAEEMIGDYDRFRSFSTEGCGRLAFRIDSMADEIKENLLVYLRSDARAAIDTWSVKNQNAFYDKNISENIAFSISVEPFKPKNNALMRYAVQTGIISAAGLVVFGNVAIGYKLVASVAAIGTASVMPRVFYDYEKKQLAEQVNAYLNQVSASVKKQVSTGIEKYKKAFADLAKELGESDI